MCASEFSPAVIGLIGVSIGWLATDWFTRRRDRQNRAGVFIGHLLSRVARMEENLLDQLFNSSEKRLARTLLALANLSTKSKVDSAVLKVSQGTLAEMVGTTRSRVNFFMNRFRKLGFVEYNGRIKVHKSLLNAVLLDQLPKLSPERLHSSAAARTR